MKSLARVQPFWCSSHEEDPIFIRFSCVSSSQWDQSAMDLLMVHMTSDRVFKLCLDDGKSFLKAWQNWMREDWAKSQQLSDDDDRDDGDDY